MDEAEAARDLLPWWMVWGPVFFYTALAFPLGLAGAALTAAVAGLPGRLRDGEHWSERARRVWPVRVGLLVSLFTLPLTVAAPILVFAGEVNGLGLLGLPTAAFVATAVAVLVVRGRVESAIVGRSSGPLRRLAGTLAMLLTYVPHLLVVLATAPLYGPEVGPRFFAVVACTAALFLVAGRGGLALARLLRLARPAPERVDRAVREIAAAEGLEVRPTLVLAWPMANAVAYPVERRIAFTALALEVLTDAEMAAVAAHEVGHLTEPGRVRWARVATSFLLLPMGMVAPLAALDGTGLIYIGVALLSFLLFALSRALFQRQEVRADAVATHHEGEPGLYARALERLHEANMAPAVLWTKVASHPHLYDRLLACGVEPGYPRPAPPSRRRGQVAALASIAAVAVVFLTIRLGFFTHETVSQDARALEVNLALVGGTASSLDDLAGVLMGSGDLSGAEPYAHAASTLSETRADYAARLAGIRARLGRCEAARQALAEAERRLAEDPLSEVDVDLAREEVAACRPST